MSTITILEDDVRRLLPMARAIDCVEKAMRSLAHGQAQNVSRSRVRMPGATLHVMSAGDASLGMFGLKGYTTTRGENRFVVLLFSIDSGKLLATIEANTLGQMRTGAASGVATRWMARSEARVLGIIGTGFQAQSQVEAVCYVRPIEEVLVFSRSQERRHAFVRKMSSRVQASIVPVESTQQCVERADVVVTITTSRDPVLEGEWLKPGTHINAAGSNALIRREIDLETVRRAGRIVVDSKQQASLECGDLVPAIESNLLKWEQVAELSDVVGGRVKGRESEDEVTLFESHGLALWDIAVATEIYHGFVSN